MLLIQPKVQLLDQEDLPGLLELFSMKSILEIELVAAYCLHNKNNRQNRFSPCGIYSSETDAKFAAESLRARGRSFAIACVPSIRLNFGFHHILISVAWRRDFEAFLPPTYIREGNVYRFGKIKHPESFLIGINFSDFYPTLCILLDPNQTLVSRVALVSLESSWQEWSSDMAFYKCSHFDSGRSIRWLPIKLYFYEQGLGEIFFDKVINQFHQLIYVS